MISVRIRGFSSPYFPSFELGTEIFSANLCIQSKYGKIRTRKTLNTDTFYTVKWFQVGKYLCNINNKKRSSRTKVFCKKGVLRNFAKFTGKHLCQSLSFYKVAALMPATLLKKRFWHRCFLVHFAKFLRTLFLTEHLKCLLVKKQKSVQGQFTIFYYFQ